MKICFLYFFFLTELLFLHWVGIASSRVPTQQMAESSRWNKVTSRGALLLFYVVSSLAPLALSLSAASASAPLSSQYHAGQLLSSLCILSLRSSCSAKSLSSKTSQPLRSISANSLSHLISISGTYVSSCSNCAVFQLDFTDLDLWKLIWGFCFNWSVVCLFRPVNE